MKKLTLISVFIYLLTSCAMHHGSISSSSVNGAVKYEDVAIGVSQTKKYFGFGGLSHDALVYEAKRILIINRPLKPNEQYLNYTIDFKESYLFFYSQTKVTVSADVVSFANDTITTAYSEIYKRKIWGESRDNKLLSLGDSVLGNKLFNLGDSVMDNNFKNVTIISFEEKNKVKLLYNSTHASKKIVLKSQYKIFTKNKNFGSYKPGDRFNGEIQISGIYKAISGEIVAVGLSSMIIKIDGDNKFEIINY